MIFYEASRVVMHILDFNITLCNRNTQIIRISYINTHFTVLLLGIFYCVAPGNILRYSVGNSCQLADHLTSLNSYLISLLELVESWGSSVDTYRINWNIKWSRSVLLAGDNKVMINMPRTWDWLSTLSSHVKWINPSQVPHLAAWSRYIWRERGDTTTFGLGKKQGLLPVSCNYWLLTPPQLRASLDSLTTPNWSSLWPGPSYGWDADI